MTSPAIEVSPVADLAAQAGWTAVDLSWTNPPGADEVVVRRTEGEQEAQSPDDGEALDLSRADAEQVTDLGLEPSTTYTYTVWVRVGGALSAPASVTVTTGEPPPESAVATAAAAAAIAALIAVPVAAILLKPEGRDLADDILDVLEPHYRRNYPGEGDAEDAAWDEFSRQMGQSLDQLEPDGTQAQVDRVVEMSAQAIVNHATHHAADPSSTKTWWTMRDSRVRQYHRPLHGHTVPFDQKFPVGPNRIGLDYPGQPVGPVELWINCVVGSTKVAWSGQDVIALTRYVATGDFIDVRTVDGHFLTITPNHPILTPGGYVKAGSLRPGDQVVAAQRATSPQVTDAPPSIEQVYEAARMTGDVQRVSGRAVDFHGDVPDAEVEVVWADRDLSRQFGIQTGHQVLIGAGVGEGSFGLGRSEQLPRHEGVSLDGVGLSAASPVLVGGFGEGAAILDAHAPHADEVRLAPGPRREFQSFQSPVDDEARDAEFLRHLQHALPFGVASSDVIEVKRYQGSHPVYNLHTSENYYFSGGILVHNCRCILTVTPTVTASGGPEVNMTTLAPDDEDEDFFPEEWLDDAEDDEDLEYADAEQVTWHAVLVPEGVESGDGRSFSHGALSWRDLPLPLRWQRADTGQHDGAIIVGTIEDVFRGEDGLIQASGTFLDINEVDEVVGQIAQGALRGVSIDVDSAEMAEGAQEGKVIFSKGRISAATLVAIPAFQEAYVKLGPLDLDSDAEKNDTSDSTSVAEGGQERGRSGVLAVDGGTHQAQRAWSEVRLYQQGPQRRGNLAGSSCRLGEYAGSDPRRPDRGSSVRERDLLQPLAHGTGDSGREYGSLQPGACFVSAGNVWVWAPVQRGEHPLGNAQTQGWFHLPGTDLSGVQTASGQGHSAQGEGPARGMGFYAEAAGKEIEEFTSDESLAISERAWDGSSSRFTDSEWKRSCVMHTCDGDQKSCHGFPVREPDGALNRAAVHNAAARINQAKASPEQVAAAKRKLRGAYRELKEDVPDSLTASAFARGAGWVTNPKETRRLHAYWTKPGHKGYAQIRWGTPGDFTRLRRALSKYISPAYLNRVAAQWHFDALGYWPGECGKPGNPPCGAKRGHMANDESVSLAAAAEPASYPAEFFTDPQLSGPTPLTVDGQRVYGHLAVFDQCHIGVKGACTTAPKSQHDYAYFRTGSVQTTGGPVNVGQLTVGTGHAPLSDAHRAAAAHYDDSGAAVADVACGEDEHGIWVAGALRDSATDEQVHALRAGALSGDWRRIGGGLELVAALVVNVPGFPIPRTALAASGGEQTSLVASGVVLDVPTDIGPLVTAVEDELFRRARARTRIAVASKVIKQQRVHALQASVEGGQ